MREESRREDEEACTIEKDLVSSIRRRRRGRRRGQEVRRINGAVGEDGDGDETPQENPRRLRRINGAVGGGGDGEGTRQENPRRSDRIRQNHAPTGTA